MHVPNLSLTQRTKAFLVEYYPDKKFIPSVFEPVQLSGHRLSLELPEEKDWRVTPDRRPCVVNTLYYTCTLGVGSYYYRRSGNFIVKIFSDLS